VYWIEIKESRFADLPAVSAAKILTGPAAGMLDKPRIRAFARFVKESGEDELFRCLERNEEAGIRYHYDKVLIGDYNVFENVDEIMSFIRDGKA